MRFGGHETFAIREGWLYKGLRALRKDPQLLYDKYAADYLGVGRNMAKSIRFWLLATELASPVMSTNGRKIVGMQLSPLGGLVWKYDRFLLERDTWWLLHANLVAKPGFAATWSWFFSDFRQRRFDRAMALSGLQRHTEAQEARTPSVKTLQRDIACLLSSYSRALPPEASDPEDATECPFIELGLLSHFRDSGMHQFNMAQKPISPETFAYAMARGLGIEHDQPGHLDVTLLETLRCTHGPAQVFSLSLESLYETAIHLEALSESQTITISGLAGERVLRQPRLAPYSWAERLFQALQGGQNAA